MHSSERTRASLAPLTDSRSVTPSASRAYARALGLWRSYFVPEPDSSGLNSPEPVSVFLHTRARATEPDRSPRRPRPRHLPADNLAELVLLRARFHEPFFRELAAHVADRLCR